MGTDKNPADVGSRGRDASKVPEMWWKGPDWLLTPDHWPNDCLAQPSNETEAEAKLVGEVLATTVETKDNLDEVLEKHGFWKTIHITAWIARYLHNCRSKQSQRLSGPLTTAETEDQIQMWIKRVQTRHSQTDQFKEDQLRLNLQKDEQGLYECRGRIQGDYPIYLPPDSPFSKKMVMDAHTQTLHGGVGLTMAFIRRKYWIPRLRQLTKKVIRSCFGCKRFQVTAFSSPPPGNLPADRTEGSAPFQVLGADYAGRIAYKLKPKKEGKAYILLFACSLTRAIHLELLPDQTKEEFIRSVKRFIARRGRPQKIYTDNGRSFIGAAKWLKKVMKDEQFQNYLAHHNIKWQFNLSRAPWWGGQFERMVGLVKGALHKSTGRALLRWSELEEVILEVEVTLNNRPLGYVEDGVQLPTLTLNVMLFGQPNLLPEEDVDSIEDTDLRKCARYLRQCKDALWSRWTGEYIKALRERHNLKHKTKELNVKNGDVVLIKGNERNRGKWNIGIVVKLIKGRDGVVRAVRLRAGKSYLERAIQQLYPMELSCDNVLEGEGATQLSADAREFRPRRAAATAAAKRIQLIAEGEITHL